MSSFVIAIIILVLLALVVLAVSFRRSDTAAAIGQLSGETVRRDRTRPNLDTSEEGAAPGITGEDVEALARGGGGTGTLVAAQDASPPAAYVPPDPETLGVTRRQFLNRSIVATFGFGLAAFSAASLAFLWPPPGGGFGSKVNVGRLDDILAAIRAGSGFLYVPQGRMWVTEYPTTAIGKAQSAYTFFPQVEQGLQSGVVALFQTCPHLGCRVPECKTSQWFECPCHGSKYNRVGEKKGGPAPRGLDRFPMVISAANELIVDTGVIIQGPPIGTNTTGQEAEGPNCLSDAGGHG
ncbi:MAG: Rieske 2Fe-2S domain-containing protein [Actinomycetia bacterium]|nr:Rieske 2Fe-2S domain-containing protein [Actinomycetes bacterium]MCP4226862.1 Rieske 2Fe-2S domain-containing protein [Actinomycetes bacterium]MCP5030320.1 Rieske 2Fe-2S domain-containing protein [Actinomycetes bacterium]